MTTYETNGYANVSISIDSNTIGVQTGTGTLTSSATGSYLIGTENYCIDQTNIATTDLANSLINDLNDKPDNKDYNVAITTISNTTYFVTKNISFSPENILVNGLNYNVTNCLDIFENFSPNIDAYGSNSTVNYYSTIFPGISFLKTSGLSLINIGPNDYILYEISVPDRKWLYNHNLFSLTPYFYDYTENNVTTKTFASVDITIQFFNYFKTIDSKNKINICITSNKTIGQYFSNKGYIISKIPFEYINSCTFLPLIRVGLINDYTFDINTFVTSYYYKSSDKIPRDNYTSNDVIASFPPSLLPSNQTFKDNLNQFNSIVSYLNTNSCNSNLTVQTAKYLSNIYNTSYAFQNFFTSITINPPAQLQANNTGENYYNSKIINLLNISEKYLYILTLNQKLMETALTSNIQIYNSENNQVIVNGEINTSSELKGFTTIDYPYSVNNNRFYPLFQLNGYEISDLISAGITSIIVVERLSYNPINFYCSSYNYTGSAYVLFGGKLTEGNIAYLNVNYDILINYN